MEITDVLSYEPKTGVFRWRVSRPPRGKKGEKAGYDNGRGYIKISFRGKSYYAHRLAFLFMGQKTPECVDHINQCPWDNRWENLRGVTQRENVCNNAKPAGVRKRDGKWEARFANKSIGRFWTKAEARAVYLNAKSQAAGLSVFRDPPPCNKKNKAAQKIKLFEGKTLSQWSRETGIPQSTLHSRIHKLGWSLEKAIGRSICNPT